MKMRAPVKNVALLFTILGAASYMHVEMPDPSEVINSENAVALRDALLKMGLAGGVLKKMKEAVDKSVSCAGDGSHSTEVSESRQRQSSLGSLEDLSQLPTTIASRLYNAFSAAPKNVSLNWHERTGKANDTEQENTNEKKLHRSKRSHSTARVPDASCKGKDCDSTPRSVSSPLLVDPNDEHLTESTQQQQYFNDSLTPDAIVHAINHPISSNPYVHIPSISNDKHEPTQSLFSFNSIHTNSSTIDNQPALNSAEVPSGCVGGMRYNFQCP
jgi:hypothetical protein